MSGGAAVAPSLGSSSPEKRVTMNDPRDFRTPSGSQARSDSGQGRLTPMPGYMRPIVKSAVRRWKKLHDDHMMAKLRVKREEKKEVNQETREEARKLAKKIPMEALAKEWFNVNKPSIETRAFLVDKVLPTLIIGCEKLLVEVDKRGLAEATMSDPSFNPINFLGQYLMRNNPRYSNFSEASPYIRGLRQISEELKKELFDIDENRLARIKAEARRRREQREEEESRRIAEKQRREDLLRRQFNEWNIGYYPNGRVELALLQNALRIFAEVAVNFPPELQKVARYCEEIGSTDDTGKMLTQKEFVTYITSFVEEMPSEIFDQFLSHMKRCATAYRAQKEREERRVNLSQLFMSCDNAGVGLLDRHRVLNLFEMYYDKAKEVIQDSLMNPREWPMVDVQEVESVYGDDEDESREMPDAKESSSEQQQTEEESGDNKATKAVTDGTEAVATETGAIEEGGGKDGTEAVVAETGAIEEGEGKEVDPDNANTEEKLIPESPQEGEDPELAKLVDSDEQQNVHTGKTGERPPMTQQSKVSFAEGTNFAQETTSMPASRNSRSQSQASAFDENTLNVSQFVHVIETFIGDVPNMEAFRQLVRFVKTGYMETEEERMQRLFKARQEAQEAKRKALLNALFEMWDNEGSGTMDLEEVEVIMKKYKEGQEVDAINQAKKQFKKKNKIHDNRIHKREFRDFVHLVVEKMSQDDVFDYFVEYMTNSVERSYAERIRGEARKKWLQTVVSTAYTSGASMEPVYDAIFQALYKDAETHGHNKVICAYVAMLEKNDIVEGRGDHMLRYVAATPDDAQYLLGKALFRDMKGISFASIDSGKPLHVPRVSNHGNIHFWNPDRHEAAKIDAFLLKNDCPPADGSLIVVPLKDRNKRVFGLLGIDTLNDPHNRALFITHEIQFFQGVAKAFSIAYHHVDVRQKTMRISESAVSWIHRRSPHVHEITVYMVEPDGRGQDYVIRKMMTTDHKGNTGLLRNPPKLERRDNLFSGLNRDYLFKCVDTSESLTADAYGERHLAIPLRDDQGLAIVVIDISIGDLKMLPRSENREVIKMLKLLQKAYDQISHESKEGEKSMLLDHEEPFPWNDPCPSHSAEKSPEQYVTPLIVKSSLSVDHEEPSPCNDPCPSHSAEKSPEQYVAPLIVKSRMSVEGDKLDDGSRTEILFDRLMLIELRDNVSKLDPKSYAELKSYADPPRIVHLIVKAVLSIFYPDKAREGEFDQWSQCKQYVTPQLSQQIEVYDPTSDVANDNVPVDMIHSDLEEVPHGQVYKHGSIPAQYLYDWVFVCISLIEHSRKMQNSSRADLLTEISPPDRKREPTNTTNAPQPLQPQQLQIDQTNVSMMGSNKSDLAAVPPPKEPSKEEEAK